MIHVQTWNRSARITDMTNAGKRGKKCEVFSFRGVLWDGGPGLDELQALEARWTIEICRGIKALSPDTSFAAAKTAVFAALANAYAEGVSPNMVACYEEEIRGVDAPVSKLTHRVPGIFSVCADETGIHMRAENDPCNEWTEITAHGQSPSQAYRLAAKVWPQVCECQRLGQAADVLRAAGCKLHGYCAVD